MKTPRIVRTSVNEKRKWGCCFNIYKGATATGMFDDELWPDADGGLHAHVPLHNALHVKALWEAAGLTKTDPRSGWRQVDNFNHFQLEIVTYKIRRHFFSPCRWATHYGLLFSKETYLNPRDTLAFPNIGYSNTADISETVLLLDKIMSAEWPFVSQKQAAEAS